MRTRPEHHGDRLPPTAVATTPRRRGRLSRALGLLAGVALAAAPAFAVAVSVTVTGADGRPVPSAEIDLGFGATATTDDAGRASLVVPDGEQGREIDAVVSYTDPRTGERRSERRRVTLGPVVEISLPNVQPAGARPGQAPPPGRELGCGFAGDRFQMAVGYGRAEIDDPPLVAQSFDFRALVDGVEVDRSSGTKNAEQIAEINRSEDNEHETDEMGPLSIRIPVGYDSCREGRRNFVPAVRLGAGEVDVDFASKNLEFPEFDERFSGDGWLYQAGFDLTFLRSAKRCVYSLGVEHRWSESINVRRSVDLATLFPPGSLTIADRVTYEYEQTAVQLTAGHAGDRFLPYVGVRYNWFEAELEQRSQIDISALFPTAPAGTLVVQDQSIFSRFDDDYAEAVAGVVARLAASLALRGEARVGEDTFAVSASAVLSLGR